jgi:peptidoglycan/xylan/chitin deacetylase (PgdA/CDA1 family)
LRNAAKTPLLFLYVYAYAPARNYLRSRRGRHDTVVLLYHRVNDGYLDSVTVGVEQFDRQLSIIRQHYEVIDIATFMKYGGGNRGRRSVLISFDDGYQDNYLAAILLRRHGLPCTFFLSTGIVGTDRAFPHDLQRLGHRVPTLRWEQVGRMAEWGFTIGNHTVDHSRVSLLPPKDALEEIAQAKSDLERHLGVSEATCSFAYPFGERTDITDEVRESLPTIGIELCFSAYGGVNEPDFDRLNVLRSGVNHSMSDLKFRAVIEGWSKPVWPGSLGPHEYR